MCVQEHENILNPVLYHGAKTKVINCRWYVTNQAMESGRRSLLIVRSQFSNCASGERSDTYGAIQDLSTMITNSSIAEQMAAQTVVQPWEEQSAWPHLIHHHQKRLHTLSDLFASAVLILIVVTYSRSWSVPSRTWTKRTNWCSLKELFCTMF